MYRTLTLPLLLTLFMHGLIVAIILIGAPDLEPIRKKAPVKYIEAKLVVLEKPKPKPKPKPAPKPRDDQAKKQAARQEAQRRAEQERVKQQQVAEKQAKQAELQKQQLAEQMRQEKLAEQKRQLQEQQKREFEELIQQEAAQRQAESDEELANSYIAMITRIVQNNWSRPPSARNNMEAELALQLVPTGEVVSVRVVNSSGNPAFDRSAEKAVLRAQRFPELQNLPPRVFEKYFRRLNLIFRPEDLRL